MDTKVSEPAPADSDELPPAGPDASIDEPTGPPRANGTTPVELPIGDLLDPSARVALSTAWIRIQNRVDDHLRQPQDTIAQLLERPIDEDSSRGAVESLTALARWLGDLGMIPAARLARQAAKELGTPAHMEHNDVGAAARAAGLLEDLRSSIATSGVGSSPTTSTGDRLLIIGEPSQPVDSVLWFAFTASFAVHHAHDLAGWPAETDAVVIVDDGDISLEAILLTARSVSERFPLPPLVVVTSRADASTRAELARYAAAIISTEARPADVVQELRRQIHLRRRQEKVVVRGTGSDADEVVNELEELGTDVWLAADDDELINGIESGRATAVVLMPASDIGRMIRLLRAQPSTRRVAIVEMIGDSPLHDQRDAVDLVLERHRLHTLATELRSNLTLRADSELAEGQDSAGRGIPWNSAVFLAERMLLGVHRNDQVASLCVVRFDDKDPLGEIDAAQEVLVSEFRSDDIVTRSADRETIAVLAGVDRQVAAGRLGSLVSRLTQVNARVAIVEFPFDARSVSDLVDGARSLLDQSLEEDGPKVVTSDWTAGQRREVDVIVADSDTPIALIITDALERCGLTVDREPDGQELLTRLLDPRIPLPRLLLLEFDLATIDGLTVLRRLKPKAALRRFEAMMLSTRTREIDLQQAFDLGASEIVQKPFSPAILVRRVLKLLDEQP